MDEPPKRSVRTFAIRGLVVGVICGIVLGAPMYVHPDGRQMEPSFRAVVYGLMESSMAFCGTVYGLFGAFLGGALALAADRQDAVKRAKAKSVRPNSN
jgi:hypothetical protein